MAIVNVFFKTSKKSIKKALLRVWSIVYYSKGGGNPVGFDEAKGDSIFIFCIVFNKYDLMNLMTKKFEKYSSPNHLLVVADNSNDLSQSKKICSYCRKEGVLYFKLPLNPYSGNLGIRKIDSFLNKSIRPRYKGSSSHALAMNWICKKVVMKYKITYFGFIDHDLFPMHTFDLLKNLLKQPFYGRLMNLNNRFYLWPGYCFFNANFVVPKDLDFRPQLEGDTGSRNSTVSLKGYNNSIKYAKYRKVRISDGDDHQRDFVEFIDEWIHIINGSNWKGLSEYDEKMIKISQLFEFGNLK